MKFAGNRSGYSNAFWEVRNKGIQKDLGAVLTVVIILIVLSIVIKLVDKKKVLRTKRKQFGTKLKELPVIGETVMHLSVLNIQLTDIMI